MVFWKDTFSLFSDKKSPIYLCKIDFWRIRGRGRGNFFFLILIVFKKKIDYRREWVKYPNWSNFSWGGGILANTHGLRLSKILLKTQWIIVNKNQQSALYDRHTFKKIRRFRHLLSQKSALCYRHTLRKNSRFWEFMVKKTL